MTEAAGATSVGATRPALRLEAGVSDFLSAGGLEGEFARASDLALRFFADASHVRVTIEDDPEEDDAPPIVALRVATSLPRKALRDARKDFYRAVRSAGCSRLCFHLAIAREW